MLRVRFADVAVLPATPIEPTGLVSKEFLAREIDTLQAAAQWLRAVPYGPNASQDALAVFRDGVGTCTTKHAAIVTLAEELGVRLQLLWGVYALDDDVIAGAGAVLAGAGVPFAPSIHCFVDSDGHYVDLTEGNCTGKRRQIEDYLSVAAVRVGASEERFWSSLAADLCERDHRFEHLTATQLHDVLMECVAANPVLCALDP